MNRYAKNMTLSIYFSEKQIRKNDSSFYCAKRNTRTPKIDTVATPPMPNARSIYFCENRHAT